MEFAQPLIHGVLRRRYQRFLAEVELDDGTVVVAHCPNSGSMRSVDLPGSEVWLSPADGPSRKLRFTWELIRIGEALIGINTSHPGTVVVEAIRDRRIGELVGYASIRREVRYGRNSRIDIFLEASGRPPCYVELKNVTMKRGGAVASPFEFPDAVTARGLKHVFELAEMVRSGARAVMLFVAQRSDGNAFAIATDIHPEYGDALNEAVASGVEVLCYCCDVSLTGVRLSRRIDQLIGIAGQLPPPSGIASVRSG